MTTPSDLTIQFAQTNQPWTVPYSPGVQDAERDLVPHILGTHCVLHAIKSVGKISAVYEALDHIDPGYMTEAQRCEIANAAADLITAALRFGNLHGFDLASHLIMRVKEKNGVDYGDKL